MANNIQIIRCNLLQFLLQFRHVILPKEMQRSLPDRLLTETEWRQLGVQQSRGWVHYAIHKYVHAARCSVRASCFVG